jgi:hypothetical protein
MFYPGGITPARITQQGTNPCDFILMACQAYEATPKIEFGDSARCTLLENTGTGMGANQIPAGALNRVAEALDDLRRLGAFDLALNFPSSV